MLRFLFSLALLGLLPFGGHAQTYFSNRYTNPTPGASTSFTTIAVRDSGYLAIGIAYDYPAIGSNSLLLQFLAPNGQTQRTRYYSPAATPGGANALHRLPDGGYILTSQYVPATFPITRYTKVWRFNALGDTVWTRQWTRQRGETAQSLCVLPDGGFAIIGTLAVGPVGGPNADFVVTRTDALGRIRWSQTYDHYVQDFGYTIAACPDGGLLLGGYSNDLRQYDTFVVKTDSLGQEQWRRSFGSPTQDDVVAAVLALRDGSYFVGANVGTRIDNGTQLYRYDTHHLDAAGQTLWTRRYGPEGRSNELHTAHELPDGRIVVAGQQSRPDGSQRPEAVIFQLCPDGDTLWYRTHKLVTGPDSHNYLRDLRPTPDGGFVASGFLIARAPDVEGNDGWVFRLDSAGYMQAGGAPVARRCRPVGLPETDSEEDGGGVDLWPNPATTTVTVRLPATNGASTLTLYDPIGRACRRLVLPAGTRTTALPLAGLAPGVYRYYLQAGVRGYQGALLVQP